VKSWYDKSVNIFYMDWEKIQSTRLLRWILMFIWSIIRRTSYCDRDLECWKAWPHKAMLVNSEHLNLSNQNQKKSHKSHT